MSQAASPKSSRWPHVALVFAICAALSAWNPFAAPAGLIVGVGAALVAWWARGKGRDRRVALWALAVGSAAAVASAVVLLLSAGALSTELRGQPVVPGRAASEVQRLLDEAGRRTEAARGRAAEELDRAPSARPGDGGPSGPDRRGPVGERKGAPRR